MSTDMQQYSIANQRAAIDAYAERHGLTIVCNYEDAGKSGLKLEGRPALKSLIVDVIGGRANFDTILVYDVSRWGRFQDSDESAHYEYICKRAGVTVQYCAEQFPNDGSITASILKNIKRAMAGEFSRELSIRVHAGQSRIARLGFHVGGTPGYALRRQLLDQSGAPKIELRFQERKSIQSDRVILVPGPAHEIEVVQLIYALFIDAKNSLNEIARTLNARLVPNVRDREWTSVAVRELLANEKYMGTSVYNRTSKKLGVKWSRNPPNEWVKKVGAYQGIVSASQFEKARRQLRSNASEYSEAELLDSLTAIWCRNQALTRDIVSQTPGAPSTNTIRRHFGSLTNAFQKIGFVSARQANYDLLQQLRREVYAKITEGVPLVDSTVSVASGRNGQLRVNGEIDLTVVIGRASKASVARGHNQWRFGYRSKRKPHILLVARVDHGCSCIRDFYVLPYLFMPQGSWILLAASITSVSRRFILRRWNRFSNCARVFRRRTSSCLLLVT